MKNSISHEHFKQKLHAHWFCDHNEPNSPSIKVDFFRVWTFLKSLLNLLQHRFFYVWVFSLEACGILAPQPGIEPATPALEGGVLTTGSPKKFLTSTLE